MAVPSAHASARIPDSFSHGVRIGIGPENVLCPFCMLSVVLCERYLFDCTVFDLQMTGIDFRETTTRHNKTD
jgi:hypothetical protein